MKHRTDDLRIREIKELAPPSHLLREFPCSDRAAELVERSRQALHRILHGMDDRSATSFQQPPGQHIVLLQPDRFEQRGAHGSLPLQQLTM